MSSATRWLDFHECVWRLDKRARLECSAFSREVVRASRSIRPQPHFFRQMKKGPSEIKLFPGTKSYILLHCTGPEWSLMLVSKVSSFFNAFRGVVELWIIVSSVTARADIQVNTHIWCCSRSQWGCNEMNWKTGAYCIEPLSLAAAYRLHLIVVKRIMELVFKIIELTHMAFRWLFSTSKCLKYHHPAFSRPIQFLWFFSTIYWLKLMLILDEFINYHNFRKKYALRANIKGRKSCLDSISRAQPYRCVQNIYVGKHGLRQHVYYFLR